MPKLNGNIFMIVKINSSKNTTAYKSDKLLCLKISGHTLESQQLSEQSFC